MKTKTDNDMTRDRFIKKWLGNPDYQYCEENRDAMREDLDSVIEHAGNHSTSYHTVETLQEAFDRGYTSGVLICKKLMRKGSL